MAKKLAIWVAKDTRWEIPMGPLADLYATDEELLDAVKKLKWTQLSTLSEPDNWTRKAEDEDLGSWRDLPMQIRHQ